MCLVYYNAKNNVMPSTPNDYYRELQQALIDDLWDNTTTLTTISQEIELGTFLFEEVEVRLNHAVDKSTGIKQGDDFREIIFKELDYNSPKGLYYYFNDNYWITINLDQYNRTSKNIFIRRCNNAIKIIDEYDGSIIKLPCVIDYDIGASAPQVDNNIITPNNHPVIIVQGNKNSRRILRQNTRIIFGNRVFKITGLNNIMQDNAFDNNASLLYLDAFQDEIHPLDDFDKGIAFNEEMNYSIELPYYELKQVQNYTTQIEPIVKLNNKIVQRDISIESSDNSVVVVNENNTIQLIGNVGDTAVVTVYLGDNRQLQSYINIEIVQDAVPIVDFILTPNITSIKQGRTCNFVVSKLVNNEITKDIVDAIPQVDINRNDFSLYHNSDNTFTLSCYAPSMTPLILKLTDGENEKNIAIDLLPMF